MISYELDLNLVPGGVSPRLDLSQYDHGQTITCVLWEGNTPFTLPNASAASVSGTKPDGTGFTYNCTYEYGQPVVTITEQMTAVAGEVICELVIVKEGERQGTVNFVLDVEKAALDQDTPLSETDIPIIEQIPEIQAEVEAAKQLAEMWAVGPDGSEEDQPSSTNNAYYWAMQAASYAGGGLKPEVVAQLPTQNISTSTLYFVPSSDPSASNFYDEYINVDGTSQGWEKIGTTSTDLTAYQTKTDNNLNTTDKTVVGAINELAGDISTINTNLSAFMPTDYVQISNFSQTNNVLTVAEEMLTEGNYNRVRYVGVLDTSSYIQGGPSAYSTYMVTQHNDTITVFTIRYGGGEIYTNGRSRNGSWTGWKKSTMTNVF